MIFAVRYLVFGRDSRATFVLARLTSMSTRLQSPSRWISVTAGLCFLVLIIGSVPHHVHHFFEEFAHFPDQRTADSRDNHHAHRDEVYAPHQPGESDHTDHSEGSHKQTGTYPCLVQAIAQDSEVKPTIIPQASIVEVALRIAPPGGDDGIGRVQLSSSAIRAPPLLV